MDYSAPWDGNSFVDGLCGENAGGAHLVHDLASLVKLEGQDIFIIGDSDNGL